jgi:hypothetical protein
MTLLPQTSGATISECGQYRYLLWRVWDTSLPTVAFVMLNPSTADAQADDPTIRRCVAFARDWGYGRLDVVNLFPLRATNPAVLSKHADPLGPAGLADTAILDAVRGAPLIICAWGGKSVARRRADTVLRQLLGIAGLSDRLHHIGLNQDGSPKHPLYIAASVRPQRWACHA